MRSGARRCGAGRRRSRRNAPGRGTHGLSCVRSGTVSLATAPEPGSKCEAKQLDDNAIATPNLWGKMGVFSGTLYQREQDGKTVYSTRKLPGSSVYLKFTVATPPGEPAHSGLGRIGKTRLTSTQRSSRPQQETGSKMRGMRASPSRRASMRARAEGRAGVMQ